MPLLGPTRLLISEKSATYTIKWSYTIIWQVRVPSVADSGFFLNFLYQGGVKSTVSWVFEDLKFKISEGYDQNWCFPDPAQLAVSV